MVAVLFTEIYKCGDTRQEGIPENRTKIKKPPQTPKSPQMVHLWMVLFQYWQVCCTAHPFTFAGTWIIWWWLTRTKYFWCYVVITSMVVWKMKCGLNMLEHCVYVSEALILLLSLPAFQTALWGWQWVLSMSQRVLPQPENTKVDKSWVGHNQKTDGKTSTVHCIFINAY